MEYIIKGTDGCANFVFNHCDGSSREYGDWRSLFKSEYQILKENTKLTDGDTVMAEIDETTDVTKQTVKTFHYFKVEQHDSFLLKLTKV